MIETLVLSPAHPFPVEARVTTPADPGDSHAESAALAHAWWSLGLLEQYREEQPVNHHTALTYSVVWRCVSYISQTIASLGWHVFEEKRGGINDKHRFRMPIEDNIAWTLGMQASPEMTAFDWRQVMLKDALTWGNGYSEIEFTRAGKPFWLHRLDPSRVDPDRDETGQLVYHVRSPMGGAEKTLPASQVFHLKGLGPDGLVGYSVIEMARRTLQQAMSQEDYGRTFFRRGPMPGGVLEIPGAVKKEERDAMRKSFEDTYGGAKNAGRVVVLTGGGKFTSMTLPNDDAQFIESRQLSAEDVCRIFCVPQHKAGILTRSTNNNIEHQSIEAVQDCLLPWCRRLETEADVKLFGRVTMGRRFTRLNLETLLRGDSRTQTENLTSQVNNGLRTVNEGRELLDLNPIPGGDTPLIQGAMIPLEQAINPADAEPAKGGDGAAEGGKPAEGGVDQDQAAESGNIQATALNGAQIAGLIAIADKQVQEQVSKDAAMSMIEASFPLMDKKLVKTIVEEIEKFEVAKPPPPKPPTPPPDEGEEADDAMPDDLRRTFLALLTDCYSRLLRVEADKSKRAENKGQLRQWADSYYGPLGLEHVKEALQPIVDAFSLASGRKGNTALAALNLAQLHIDAGLADPSPVALTGRAEQQASEHLAQLWSYVRPASPAASRGKAVVIHNHISVPPPPPRTLTKTVVRDDKGRIGKTIEEESDHAE